MCERQSETETSDPFLSSELSLCNMHIKEEKNPTKNPTKARCTICAQYVRRRARGGADYPTVCEII